jgi:hypothetical protein
MSRESVEIVRRLNETWGRGDLDALYDFYDPGVEWEMTHSYVPDMGVYGAMTGCGCSFGSGGPSSPSTTPSRRSSSTPTRAWWSESGTEGAAGTAPSPASRRLPSRSRWLASGKSSGFVTAEPCGRDLPRSGRMDGEAAGLAICRASRPPGKDAVSDACYARERARTPPGDATQPGNGEAQNRTGDTTIFSRVLYQLSYLAEAARRW